IYFDLDRTLWDFDANSREALGDLYRRFNLDTLFSSPEDFIDSYHKHNERLWAQYREGNLTKAILRSKRFELTLKDKKVKDPILAARMGEEYLSQSVLKTILFPNTLEILDYLKPKYNLYILTNGFRETQFKKLGNCGLDVYFDEVFTSETIGYNKPHQKIFEWAITAVNAKKDECIMIGDDQKVDIAGAKQFGMDTFFFNPLKEGSVVESTYTIHDLSELENIL
ncbi:MAG: YjjG family noncanonical pyrimidine nucleotidase, partial [Bacteroidales bacterium]